jgi:pilus assembly protein CpaB
MRGRLLILVGLIILLVVIVFVVFSSGILNQPPPVVPTPGAGTEQVVVNTTPATAIPTPIPAVPIVYALQNLPRGFKFPATMDGMKDVAGYTPWPQDAVPFGAITEDSGGLEFLLGKIARTDIFREQPILTDLVVENLADIAHVGSDAAAVLPSDRVAVSFPIDRITSAAYAIQDGDHVDLIISMLFVDVDLVFQTLVPNTITLFSQNGQELTLLQTLSGRPDQTAFGPAIIGPSEQQRPRLVTQRTIQDAIVVHVGDFPVGGHFLETPTAVPVQQQDTGDGSSGGGGTPPPPPTPIPRPDIITLAVSPQDAVVLVWMIEAKLPVTLALRSVNDTSRGATLPVTLDYMMSQFNIDVPARRDFTIEPAIRSIRQLLAGQEISLKQDQSVQSSTGQ